MSEVKNSVLNSLNALMDPYELRARFAPAVLTIMPVLIPVILLIPRISIVWTSICGLTLSCGGATMIGQLGRSRGKKLEPDLFAFWGGKPSVAMLRHRDSRIDAATKQRYHEFLSTTVPKLELATLEGELQQPEQADIGYEGANTYLLAHTRDVKKFSLLFKDNVAYGYRRNTWALKPWAITIGTLALVSLGVILFIPWSIDFITTVRKNTFELAASFTYALAHLSIFSFYVNKQWVRVAAEAYATRLLESCDIL